MENPIIKPDIPYKGQIPGGLVPGRMCRIQGVSHPDSDRFNINFQTGPRPQDDTALHISVRHKQGYIARNSYVNEEWGEEMGDGELTIGQAESWEIIVLVNQDDYKIAVNGQHFCEFPHRVPFSKVTSLLIDGDVSITLISWEGITGLGEGDNVKKVSQNHADSTQWAPQGGQDGYAAPQGGGYGPPQGGYGAPQGGYMPPQGYGGYGAPPQGYGPPVPPGSQPESSFDNFLEGAQSMLSGAIKSGAASALIGKFLGGGNDAQRGYSHNNAKYGIYPDLPQDANLNLNQGHQQSQGPVEKLLSGLLSGGGSGTQQQPGTGAPGNQQGQVDIAALLTNLLSNHEESKVPQSHGAAQGPGTQQGGGPDISSFLSGLLSNYNQQPGPSPGGYGPPTSQTGSQGPPTQSGGDIGSFLSGLLSNHQQPGGQVPPGSQPQSQGVDVGGLLSNLLSGTATRPIQETHPTGGTQPSYGGTQPQGGSDFGSLLSNFLSSGPQQQPYGPTGNQGNSGRPGNQQSQGLDLSSLLSGLLSTTDGGHQGGPHPPYGGNVPYGPPGGAPPPSGPTGGSQPYTGPQPPRGPTGGSQAYSGPPGGVQPPTTGAPQSKTSGTAYNTSEGDRPTSASKGASADFEDVSDQLEREMAREGHRQYSGSQGNKQSGEGEQYGYYPHPPEQQKGPLENLLSGFLSGGGGGQQQPAYQQPHGPQYGGGGSMGGLGGMGGLLENFAGQILHPRDGNNQRQNY